MNHKRNALIISTLFLATGCQPAAHSTTSSTNLPPLVSTAPSETLQQSVTQRVNGLAQPVESLRAKVMQMPEPTESAHRKLVAGAFGDIAAILPLLQGPDDSGAFRQQLRLITSSQAQLEALGPDLSSEPTIASGLRTTFNALSGLASGQFAGDTQIQSTLATLGANIDSLDVTHGDVTRHTQSLSMREVLSIVTQMHQMLIDRLGKAPEPKPNVPPTAKPAPATHPVAASRPAHATTKQ